MKDYTIETHTDTGRRERGMAWTKHPFWVLVRVKPIMSSVVSSDDDAMLAWCRDQFGAPGGRHAWRTIVRLHERRFMFRERSSAVAFKVRWG